MDTRVEAATTCGVCSDVYEKGPREPLVLPCGHTFCRRCVTSVSESANCCCPTCRRTHNNVDVDELAINYSLLSLSSPRNEFQCETCSHHGGDLTYWCEECEVPLCGLCLYSGHPEGHTVLLAKRCLQQKKDALREQIKELRDVVDDRKRHVKSRFYECALEMKNLCQVNTRLCDLDKQVMELSCDVQKACSLGSVAVSEALVKSFLGEMTKNSSCQDTETVSGESESGTTAIDGSAASKCEAGAVVFRKRTSAVNFERVDNRQTRLDCRDDKLLLHSLTDCVDSSLFLKVPSDVFLEVGVNGRSLGRVGIHLWSHLRRAQHFLALCMGTLGPSYVGAEFYVHGLKDNFTLDVDHYLYPDGTTGNEILVNGLEWGGRYAKSRKRGYVTALCVTPDRDSYGFSICLKSNPERDFQCPFGEVIFGLEVAEKAFNLNPASVATIIDCGLIVDGFMP